MHVKLLFDALTKSNELKQIYTKIEKMSIDCENAFKFAWKSFAEKNPDVAREVIDKDDVIDLDEIKIREDIARYLALTFPPTADIQSALVLSNLVINYERIGDYCNGIASVLSFYPAKLEKDEYFENIDLMRQTIEKQFVLVRESFKQENISVAKNIVNSYEGIKLLHSNLINKLSQTKNIEVNKAIVYAVMGIYLRRISAHLKNIITGILKPYPLYEHHKR